MPVGSPLCKTTSEVERMNHQMSEAHLFYSGCLVARTHFGTSKRVLLRLLFCLFGAVESYWDPRRICVWLGMQALPD